MLDDNQWEYMDWMLQQCGPDVAKSTDWRRLIYEATKNVRARFPGRYRDAWNDEEWAKAASRNAA